MAEKINYCIFEWHSGDGDYHGKEMLKTKADMVAMIDRHLSSYAGNVKFEVFEL